MMVSRSLSRFEPLALIAVDFLSSIVAVYVAAWGRASWDRQALVGTPLLWLSLAALINVVVFAFFQMYNSLWRYASITEALRIAAAVTLGSLIGDTALRLLFGGFTLRECFTAWAVLLLLVGGTRMLIRALWGSQSWRFAKRKRPHLLRTLIVGAGQTGSLTIKRMMSGDDDVHGDPVALVDDDQTKWGQRIHGVKVWGACQEIEKIARDAEAEQIVLACPSASRAERLRILEFCMKTGLRVLTLPNVRDIPINGLGRLALQEVDVNDLLARDEICLDLGGLSYVRDKVVLVTGGGGSIGSEIVRQLLPAGPSKVIVFDIYENTTYELLHELTPSVSRTHTELKVIIGSVTDPVAIRNCFSEHRPDVVFHAAAHKHVPLMEGNAREAIVNNVFGTRAVALLAQEHRCSHFVLVSTDKAVNPTNVMGATKRMCEIVVQSLAATSQSTIFAVVRFGNVLGSHGSVIPLFHRQLKEGGAAHSHPYGCHALLHDHS